MILIILLSIAIFQGIVIGFILLKSPFFKSKANNYLAYAIYSLSLSFLNLVLDITDAFDSYPFLKFIDIIDSAFLFPIFILLFSIYQIKNHPKKHHKKLRWLFVPYIISFLFSVLETFNTKTNSPDGSLHLVNIITNILDVMFFIFTLFFIPLILTKTYIFINYSKNKEEKKWLTYLWCFEVAFLMSWLLVLFLSPFFEGEESNVMHIIALFTTLLIHWVAYFGVFKLKLAKEQEKIRAIFKQEISSENSTITPNILYQKETGEHKDKTKKPEDNSYFKELERLCNDQKIFRDSSLDRNKVADMLGISSSYVSQIVNSITGENLANYINQYRVEEVKKLILDKDFENYSLLAIGLECGFSSKTTYYNSFKKIAGMTPNTFRKANK